MPDNDDALTRQNAALTRALLEWIASAPRTFAAFANAAAKICADAPGIIPTRSFPGLLRPYATRSFSDFQGASDLTASAIGSTFTTAMAM